jgi:hypothetical protein
MSKAVKGDENFNNVKTFIADGGYADKRSRPPPKTVGKSISSPGKKASSS